MKTSFCASLIAGLLATTVTGFATDLRIGLQEDIDLLDPARSRAFVNRIVFTSFCDSLIDLDENMNFVPRLATDWSWGDENMSLTLTLREDALFHDGTTVDAAAVKYNLERYKTLEGSLRASEIAAIDTVEVAGPYSVKLNLTQADSTLISQLSGWAGMIISPAAAEGGNFPNEPACSGPYQFVERIQNDRIVFEKFDDYWNADEYQFDRLLFMPVPDATVRVANLRAGGLDIIERVAPSDFEAIESDANTNLVTTAGLGYQGFRINLTNGAGAENSPLATDARVRQALNLSIDREIINEIVGQGAYGPATQPFAPSSFAHDERFNFKRDVEKAKALLAEAGHERVSFELMFGNNTIQQQVYELVQAMAAEAGFDITLRAVEHATLLAAMREGNFQAGMSGWAGRVDPDGNISHYIMCEGSFNDVGFCNEEVDAALAAARATTDLDERKAEYDKVQEVLQQEVPQVFIYFQPWPYGVRTNIEGFKAYADGMIRLAGVTAGE